MNQANELKRKEIFVYMMANAGLMMPEFKFKNQSFHCYINGSFRISIANEEPSHLDRRDREN